MPKRKFRKLGNSKRKAFAAAAALPISAVSTTPSRERGSNQKKRSRTARRSSTGSRVVPPYPITRCPADILDGLDAFDGPNAGARKVHDMLHRIVESECSGIEKAFSGADEGLSATRASHVPSVWRLRSRRLTRFSLHSHTFPPLHPPSDGRGPRVLRCSERAVRPAS